MTTKISLTKVLAFISPFVATLAGALATWLLTNLHFLATFHVGQSAVASAIAQGIIFGVTAIGTYLIQHKLLSGLIELDKVRLQAQLAQRPAPARPVA